MIIMALICVLGLIALAIVTAFFLSIRGSRLAAVAHAIDAEIATKIRRAEDIEAALAEALEGGAPVDRALAEFQKARADVLTVAGRTAAPWAWDKDDVCAFRANERMRRSEEVNRRLIVPAVTGSLLVVAITASIIAINYSFFSAVPVEAVPSVHNTTQTADAVPQSPATEFPELPLALPLGDLMPAEPETSPPAEPMN